MLGVGKETNFFTCSIHYTLPWRISFPLELGPRQRYPVLFGRVIEAKLSIIKCVLTILVLAEIFSLDCYS